MKHLNSKKRLFIFSAVLFVVIITGYVLLKQPRKPIERIPDPQALLQERKNQAIKVFTTPLGQSFEKRDWDQFKNLYHPEKDYSTLAECIRATYIQTGLSPFSSQDLTILYDLVVRSFLAIPTKDLPRTHFFQTQLLRLDLLVPAEALVQMLNPLWASKNPILQRLYLEKVVLQLPSPPKKAIDQFIQRIQNPDRPESRVQLIAKIDEIRNRKIAADMTLSLKSKVQQYSSLERATWAQVAAQNTHFTFSKIDKEWNALIKNFKPETADLLVRTLGVLLRRQEIDEKQKVEWARALKGQQNPQSTPYFNAKIAEILTALKI